MIKYLLKEIIIQPIKDCEAPRNSRRFFYCLKRFVYIAAQNSQLMNELVERLTTEAGITPEQAQKAIAAIAGFVKEKFPMIGGAVDQIFTGGGSQ